MRRLLALRVIFVSFIALMLISCGSTTAPSVPLKRTASIPLPDVQGRIDHLGVDVAGMRLFVAALGNNTVEVIDLRTNQRVRSITGVKQPQGVLYLPDTHRLIVSCAADGTCRIFNGDSYELLRTVSFKADADNLRYDVSSGRVYVGFGEGGVAAFDPESGTADTALAVSLPAHPESFQLEARGTRIFINVPGLQEVVVADRAVGVADIVKPLVDVSQNYPMALDETNHRLFIGCRKPACLLVMNTENGRIVANLPCAGDADDVFHDAAHKRVYISGGAGFISVFEQRNADTYADLGKVPTAPGARTSLYLPQLNALYVAVPRRDSQPAEISIYEVQ